MANSYKLQLSNFNGVKLMFKLLKFNIRDILNSSQREQTLISRL